VHSKICRVKRRSFFLGRKQLENAFFFKNSHLFWGLGVRWFWVGLNHFTCFAVLKLHGNNELEGLSAEEVNFNQP
jgi:hypothetical protein